jgi:hypothetical protein
METPNFEPIPADRIRLNPPEWIQIIAILALEFRRQNPTKSAAIALTDSH